MDTRFWGPSGWRLLHLITFQYNPAKQKTCVKELFETLPFVLPCKYCRASLTEYLEKEPLEPALASRAKLTHWLYRVHNHVNAKLRSQGLNQQPDPPFDTVQRIYEERARQGCIRTAFEGWDFLFSVAENHPYTVGKGTPMPEVPPEAWKSKDPIIQNHWNLMKPSARIPFYTRFWKSLGDCLPFEEWRSAWSGCSPAFSLIKSPKRWKKELWRIRCCLEERLDLVNREDFSSVCRRLEEHKSGCNRKRKAKTCRKLTPKKNQTRKNR
jgi:hypothetical protein